jgi:hypothetical protein
MLREPAWRAGASCGRFPVPRAEADANHVKAKTQVLQLRLMEKKRELVRRADWTR